MSNLQFFVNTQNTGKPWCMLIILYITHTSLISLLFTTTNKTSKKKPWSQVSYAAIKLLTCLHWVPIHHIMSCLSWKCTKLPIQFTLLQPVRIYSEVLTNPPPLQPAPLALQPDVKILSSTWKCRKISQRQRVCIGHLHILMTNCGANLKIIGSIKNPVKPYADICTW